MVAVGAGEMPASHGRTLSLQGWLAISAARPGAFGTGRSLSAGGGRPSPDVLPAGSGPRERQAVPRCRSALPGPARGRWRSIRSWDCWPWGATLPRVRSTVEGGAGASAVWECRGVEGMLPDRGGSREQEPPGGRQAGRGGGATAVAVPLERLALVFTRAARPVNGLIPALRGGSRPGGDAQAWRVASGPPVRLEDAPPGLGPGGGPLGNLGLETAAVGRARVLGLGEGRPLLV